MNSEVKNDCKFVFISLFLFFLVQLDSLMKTNKVEESSYTGRKVGIVFFNLLFF